ncbi:FAD-dependent monooxygenase [Lichenihabitans psoromatis]|uniref:FAD-dependent monooxygenase n=1 Tax=Lichenihabitans psoromatis TaxID=2528642 RepID=UPI001036DDB0|nr:FAD-dependent monooxygenase [Lichenihabitans psoromatis]
MRHVVMAGAGIAGLTAALSLARHGTKISVFDRAPELHEAGAGLQLPPNATRVMADLGLLERLRETAVRPDRLRIRRGRDGATIVDLPFGAAAEARYGAPLLVIHRADLQAALLEAVWAHPSITIETGQSVTSFAVDGGTVIANLSSEGHNRSIASDGLIGADGLRSSIRSRLAADRGDDRTYAGRIAWRTLVPAAEAPAFARASATNLWLGSDAHLVHYPVRGGALINVVAIVADRWEGSEAAPSLWTVRGDSARLKKPFAAWSREARDLIEAAPDWRIWPLFDRPPLARWSTGPITLVGDAAHPALPFLAQGAAGAIEDGWALGLAAARHPSDTPATFAAYERLRHAKADRVQRESRRQGSVYHFGAVAGMARDLAMRSMGQRRMLDRYDWLYGKPAADA